MFICKMEYSNIDLPTLYFKLQNKILKSKWAVCDHEGDRIAR